MSPKKILVFIYLSVLAFNTSASKIEGAFEALSIYDYFKARKEFYQLIYKKDVSTAACYGLATIFYHSDNPFHQLDSAAKYINLSGNYYRQNPLKQKYFGYTIDSLSIHRMADSIAEQSFGIIKKTPTVAAYEKFLGTHLLAKRSNAFYLRDNLVYKTILTYNTSDSTRIAMLRYPESYFINDYLLLLDKQVFEEETEDKSINQYIAFIDRHPTNKFVTQAQDELFDIYRNKTTLTELDFYIRSFPKSNMINEAWKLLYSLSVKSYNNTELQNFIQQYPDFPFKASINKEIELNDKILLPYAENERLGYIDTSGFYPIMPFYESAGYFKEGFAVVERNDSVWFINKANENVFNTVFKDAYSFNNGMAPVNKNDSWFLINRQGQTIAGPFEELSEQSENTYVFKRNGKYGAIDAYGNKIIPEQFDKLGDFKNGMAYYVSNNNYGFVNRAGLSSKAQYQWISDFDENKIAIMKQNDQFGLCDQNDTVILAPSFDQIIKADHNVFIVVKNGKYGFYSGTGCFIANAEYEYKKELPADFYTNGKYFKLIKNKKQALIEANGHRMIDFGTYEEVNLPSDHLIRVKKQSKYGFLDRKMNLVIPFKFYDASDFQDSLCICTFKDKNCLINTKGVEVFSTFGYIKPVKRGYYVVLEDETARIINSHGKTVFSAVGSFQWSADGFLILEFENKTKKILKL